MRVCVLIIFYFYALLPSSYCFGSYLEIVSETLSTALIPFFNKSRLLTPIFSTILNSPEAGEWGREDGGTGRGEDGGTGRGEGKGREGGRGRDGKEGGR